LSVCSTFLLGHLFGDIDRPFFHLSKLVLVPPQKNTWRTKKLAPFGVSHPPPVAISAAEPGFTSSLIGS